MSVVTSAQSASRYNEDHATVHMGALEVYINYAVFKRIKKY